MKTEDVPPEMVKEMETRRAEMISTLADVWRYIYAVCICVSVYLCMCSFIIVLRPYPFVRLNFLYVPT